MLEIQGITMTFARNTVNAHRALNGISLMIAPGDFVTVLGSNGAGKSTLLNAICGTFMPDEGRILLAGEDITYMKEHRRARSIGRLFQDPMKGTAPDMTIEENLALAYSRSRHGRLNRAVRKCDTALFQEALRPFGLGLEGRLRTKVGLLSGGERQAMTLLMATIASPKILLLDEHTAALDPAMAEKVLDITQSIIQAQQLTAMMITHNIHSALALGNRTIMMDAGRIILDIQGEERSRMTVDALLTMYRQKSGEALATDRMLLTR